MRQRDLRDLLNMAVKKQNELCQLLSGSSNPQVQEQRAKAAGRVEVYQAVLGALDGIRYLIELDIK